MKFDKDLFSGVFGKAAESYTAVTKEARTKTNQVGALALGFAEQVSLMAKAAIVPTGKEKPSIADKVLSYIPIDS